MIKKKRILNCYNTARGNHSCNLIKGGVYYVTKYVTIPHAAITVVIKAGFLKAVNVIEVTIPHAAITVVIIIFDERLVELAYKLLQYRTRQSQLQSEDLLIPICGKKMLLQYRTRQSQL